MLLGLISKHKLDITEIALSQVTDEFIAHMRRARTEDDWDLSQASEFLLIASTLLEIKAARLLPRVAGDSEEDFELIEARDLLFARLLQYRAFKDVAQLFAEQMETSGRIVSRQAGLEERFAGLLPELVMSVTPEQLAVMASGALTPKMPPQVALEHLHVSPVSVKEQQEIVVTRLRESHEMTFVEISADADSTLVVVARFLAILELFKAASITLEQQEQLGSLVVRWGETV